MSPGTIALIVVAVSIAAWGLFMASVTMRRDKRTEVAAGPPGAATPAADTGRGTAEATATLTEDAETGTPEAPAVEVKKVPEKQRKPLTPQQLAVSRRQFLNRAWTMSFMAFLGFFGMSTLSFLWPKLTGGFGTKITVGNHEDLIQAVGPESNFKPMFVAEGRFWLTYYEGTADAPVYLAINAEDTKLQALYRKCVHLGCSVVASSTSRRNCREASSNAWRSPGRSSIGRGSCSPTSPRGISMREPAGGSWGCSTS